MSDCIPFTLDRIKKYTFCVMHAAQSRGLILPVAAISKPLTLSAPEDVSQPTSIQRLSTSMPSDYDYISSFAGDVLSEKHRASSTVSMTSLCSPTHGKYIYKYSLSGLYFGFHSSAGPSDLQWNTRPDISALQKMYSPIDAAVHSDTAYFRPYRSRKIYSYNLTSGWSKSAKCLVRYASLVVLPVAYEGADHFHLHTIGGIKRKIHRQDEDEEEYTDVIYQLTDREWTCSIYPKLRTKRSQMTVVFSNGCLIIAGGNSAHGIIQTVDVLIVTCQDKVWCEIASLPYKVFRASGCVCNGMLYILGGYIVNKEGDLVPTRNACVATVSQLVKSHTDDHDIFRKIQNLEFKTSACVSFRNHVLAIGGWKFNTETGQQKGTKLVYAYHIGEDVWKELKGQLSRPRCLGFAAAFEDKIMTVGGYNRPNGTCTDSVEFGILPSDEPKQVCQALLPSEREAGVQGALVSDSQLDCVRERKVWFV